MPDLWADVMTKPMPSWLAEQIERRARGAQPATCACGADVLVGRDNDTCFAEVVVDAEPVTELLAAVALLSGRGVLARYGDDLVWREPIDLSGPDNPPLHLVHRCPDGRQPAMPKCDGCGAARRLTPTVFGDVCATCAVTR